MMNLLVTGASGLIGSAVAPALTREGWEVIPARRGAAGPGEARWDPLTGEIAGIGRVQAVLNLAGVSLVARRWSAGYRESIRTSRVDATHALSAVLARRDPPPEVLVSASAVGYYGDRGDEVLDEDSPPGRGFLAETARAWEEACQPAAEAGIRVVHLRLGIVLTRRGGALPPLIATFRLGIGGPMGTGQQFWSWIELGDLVSVIRRALRDPAFRGPINATAPEASRQCDWARLLGRLLRRPTLARAPASALRLILGGVADEMLLASARARPARLESLGFRWQHERLEGALRSALESGS